MDYLDMLPAFAGWFLPYDRDLLLVVDDYDEVETAFRHLIRIGYDHMIGFLDDGLHAWEISGRPYQTIPAVHAGELVRRINQKEDFMLLDVRKRSEFQEARLPGCSRDSSRAARWSKGPITKKIRPRSAGDGSFWQVWW